MPFSTPYTFCLSIVVFRILQSDFYIVWSHNLRTTELIFNKLHILGPWLSILFYVIYKRASELTWIKVLEEVTGQRCRNCYMLCGANLFLSLKACSGYIALRNKPHILEDLTTSVICNAVLKCAFKLLTGTLNIFVTFVIIKRTFILVLCGSCFVFTKKCVYHLFLSLKLWWCFKLFELVSYEWNMFNSE